MIEGFKNFLMRGNVIDLAVGVIIGAAFGGIVDAFTKGIMDPLIGSLAGDPQVGLKVGMFDVGVVITAIINFVIKAAVVYFFIVLPMNNFAARFVPPPAPPTPSEALLKEIRDLMAKRT
jgi:large conductance mechanosensitive channel